MECNKHNHGSFKLLFFLLSKLGMARLGNLGPVMDMVMFQNFSV